MSLLSFLNRSYLTVFILTSCLFIFMIGYMNQFGMDDTTEYYMLYEGEVLTEYYRPGELILEFDAGSKEYYWGEHALPDRYTQLFNGHSPVVNQANLYQDETHFIYVLPYQAADNQSRLYVVHLFPAESESIVSNQHRLNVSIIAGGALLVIVILLLVVNRFVSKQVERFDGWIKALSSKSLSEITNKGMVPSFSFEELNDAAESLKQSLSQQYALQQNELAYIKHEQDMLSCLSHEMRTPIAVIAAAIAVLNKRDQLSDKDKKVLQKLMKANEQLTLMTNTLLQLWRKQPLVSQSEIIDLTLLIKQLIDEDIARVFQRVEFDIKVINNLKINQDPTLVQLVVSNLVRNACQYSTDNQVKVLIDNDLLVVSNTFDPSLTDQSPTQTSQFGFGLGLFLVEKICEQQGWSIVTKETGNEFTVTLRFDVVNE